MKTYACALRPKKPGSSRARSSILFCGLKLRKMFCCSCGAECVSAANFCRQCGYQIDSSKKELGSVDTDELIIEYFHRGYPYSAIVRRCLHDTRSSFIPVRLHPGSILSIYICLHDTNQNCIPERVVPERLHPGSRIGSKFSFQNEICLHVPSVSCKGGTGSFRYGNKQVDWLG